MSYRTPLNFSIPKHLGLTFHPATHRKYSEPYLLIHNFGGNSKNFKNQIQFYQNKGFDCYTLDISSKLISFKTLFPLSWERWKLKWGFQYIWTQTIKNALKYLSFPLHIHCQSLPSANTLAVLDKRVRSIIIECGSSFHLYQSSRLLLKNYYQIKHPFLNLPMSFLTCLLYGPTHTQRLIKSLKNLPTKLAILFLAGGRDSIIPLKDIEELRDYLVKHRPDLSVELFNISEGRHLDLVINHSEIYFKKLGEFIKIPRRK